MNTRSRTSETDIAAAVVKWLRDSGWTVRGEVPCTIPSVGQCFADILAVQTDATSECVLVVECKLRPDAVVEEQAKRWGGLADHIAIAYEMFKQPHRYDKRIKHLEYVGIGRFEVDTINVDPPMVFGQRLGPALSCDNRLLLAAFHKSDGTQDLASGSKTGKRAIESRTIWEPASHYLRARGSASTWKEVQRFVPSMKKHTSQAARKAIDREECLGVQYRTVGGIAEFYATEEKK